MDHLEKSRQRFTRKMDALRKKQAFPAALLDLLDRVAARQFQAQATYGGLAADVSPEVEPRRHAQGASLLPRASFPVFTEQAQTLCMGILEDLRSLGGNLGAGGERIQEALDSGELDLQQVFAAYLTEQRDVFDAWTDKMPETPRLLNFLVQSSMSPFMEEVGRALFKKTELDVWEHGHCPVCGSLPFISSLEGKEGQRMMHCSFCRAKYRVPRLGCIFCGEKDAQKLHYFDVEEVPGFRVELCDQCKMCIKTADFRTMDRVSVPVLDDLESLTLDVLAQARGYVRPTLSAWGF